MTHSPVAELIQTWFSGVTLGMKLYFKENFMGGFKEDVISMEDELDFDTDFEPTEDELRDMRDQAAFDQLCGLEKDFMHLQDRIKYYGEKVDLETVESVLVMLRELKKVMAVPDGAA